MKTALIIGNGISRKEFDLKELSEGKISFGCNALYRTFKSDFLIAIDDVLISEIIMSSYPQDRFIVPPTDEQYEPFEWNPNRPRENAGMVAMRTAIKKGFTTLDCVGMDFLIDNYEYAMNNIFRGSSGYTRTAAYEDTLNRKEYFKWFVKKNPNIQFNMIFPKNGLTFHEIPGKNIEFQEI